MKTVYLLPLLMLIAVPVAYGDIKSFSMQQDTYNGDEGIIFEGSESVGKQSVFVIIRNDDGGYMGMVSDPASDHDGTYSTIPRDVSNFFRYAGAFEAIAFTDEQKEKNGVSIKLQFDGNVLTLVEGTGPIEIDDEPQDVPDNLPDDIPDDSDEDLKAEVERLRGEVSSLESENTMLRSNILSLEQEVDELNDQIVEMTQTFVDNIIMIEQLFKDEIAKIQAQQS